jgi:hypothetical protein
MRCAVCADAPMRRSLFRCADAPMRRLFCEPAVAHRPKPPTQYKGRGAEGRGACGGVPAPHAPGWPGLPAVACRGPLWRGPGAGRPGRGAGGLPAGGPVQARARHAAHRKMAEPRALGRREHDARQRHVVSSSHSRLAIHRALQDIRLPLQRRHSVEHATRRIHRP